MGLIIKNNMLCVLFLIMLGSAAVTHRFVHMGHVLYEQTSQDWSRQIVPPADPEIYYLFGSPDINIPPVNLPKADEPASYSVSAADIWTRMRNGFVFPVVDSDVIRTYINEYTKHPSLLKQVLQRGEPYLFHILARLEQEDLPAELALLPIVESSFDPFATSCRRCRYLAIYV